MLISSLCEYYDVLAKQGKLLPEGYSNVHINYLVCLSINGKIDQIIELLDEKKDYLFPKRIRTTKVEANIVEHRSEYLFGLKYVVKDNVSSLKTNFVKHQNFVNKNLKFFDGLNDPVCTAFRNFMLTWSPENEILNTELVKLKGSLNTAHFAFCLSGRPDLLLNENPSVLDRWKEKMDELLDTKNVKKTQCAILGSVQPVSRTHAGIYNVYGGRTSGCALVCYNNPSEESYGKEQSFNSNISEEAMIKYTTALNYLTSNKKHCHIVGDVTIVHWAASGDTKCDDLFSMLEFSSVQDAAHVDEALRTIVENIKTGQIKTDIHDLMSNGNMDPSVTFYIVGLKANDSRLIVQFFYRQHFGKLISNIEQHQLDMRLDSSYHKNISLFQIGEQLIPPNRNKDIKATQLQDDANSSSKPKKNTPQPDASTISKTLDAIINGYSYPESLYQTVLRRIKTDHDTENKSYINMNDVRLGILKACINKKNRLKGQKEEITMGLNVQNKNPAYLCGRLFSVLERIQIKATQKSGSDKKLNRTIVDTYFTTASTKPAIVFPRLLSLSQHHMKKLDNAYYYDKCIQDIIESLGNEFPNILSLKDQGIFMIGYYQQKCDSIKKAQNKKTKMNEEEE